jgi:hypothetical protein
MDFIEPWLHIFSDDRNGAAELLMVTITIVTIVMLMALALRSHFPRNFIDYLEQLGKRENSDRFDN